MKEDEGLWNNIFLTISWPFFLLLSIVLNRENVLLLDFRFIVASVLQGISCFFLLLTLIVYGCLPALQNLHGKTLMCHAASLLMAYACLCIIPWVTPDKHPKEDEYATMFCSALGMFILCVTCMLVHKPNESWLYFFLKAFSLSWKPSF